MVTLTSLGGAGTVTGSKHLLEANRRRILVDCGLFQGLKNLRELNWARFPVDPASIDAVVLTHAHLDHCGYIPRLATQGFRGPVVCTDATRDVAELILKDSGHLQEKDAEFANRHGFSKHKPALPLYGVEDAERALGLFAPARLHTPIALPGGAKAFFRSAGHILGAATVEIVWEGVTVVFSGDLGRYDDPLMVDPEPVAHADYLVVESTYGDRLHEKRDPAEALAEVIERTVARGGTVVIPAFAVGRAQELLYHLWTLKQAGRLPLIPVYLDSPMAIDASNLYCRHAKDHRLAPAMCRQVCAVATYVRDVEASKALSANPMPKVIVSASGMATGGRVLHHLKAFGGDRRNTILFSGFQAAGTRGRDLIEGRDEVKIHGQWIRIEAEIADLSMLSAHADADEIMRWLGGFQTPPRKTFVVHGEPSASEALRVRIGRQLRWDACAPLQGQPHAL
ncbi:MAG: MBL fold metallo-hydrolase RNA specificity domain-containing protein [Caulobacteraceae bacterium]